MLIQYDISSESLSIRLDCKTEIELDVFEASRSVSFTTDGPLLQW